MNVELKENERVDDLEFNNLKIIQNEKWFCFGIDAVLLSDFAKNIKKDSMVMDLGTGTGIISILLCEKTNLKKIIGVEVQEEVYNMACRNSKLNNLENKFEVINQNILNLKDMYKNNSLDVIVTNPPYKKINTGVVNYEEKKLISRHEILANLEDYINISSSLLKDKGEFYMVHRPDRLVDILENMRKYKLEPKEIKLVYSRSNQPPKLVLIKGVKNGKAFLKFRENLYIYNKNGEYTDEILKIYNKN
ncbi:MAG: tRNA1(Val) (adenine(37)-N6)-methyltransferase [Clostridia bacterium]|nr:tRNA1(Val) (adenine(37)-N6)-methyltransferase [Clostridia bacterium]